jgi:hypothetical protein
VGRPPSGGMVLNGTSKQPARSCMANSQSDRQSDRQSIIQTVSLSVSQSVSQAFSQPLSQPVSQARRQHHKLSTSGSCCHCLHYPCCCAASSNCCARQGLCYVLHWINAGQRRRPALIMCVN